MASPAETTLRARLDTLLREVGVATSKGTMLEDAQRVAEAVGISFSSVRAAVEEAEEALLGGAVAAALAQAGGPGSERSQQPLQGALEAPAEPAAKRRRSGSGGGPQDAARPEPRPPAAGGPARGAFGIFCAERRAEAARSLGLPPGAENSTEVDVALGEAWGSLGQEEKEGYNACAAVERQLCALEGLRRGVRSEAHAPKIARRVREAIAIMANAPKTARASGLFEGIVAALEDLDRRMGPRVRAKLGEHLGTALVSKEAQAIARRVFGQLNGTRLVMLLRRWCDPQQQAGVPAEPSSRPRLNKPGAIVKVHAAGPTSDETRGKVSEFLARIFAKCSSASAVDLAREIERELFELAGEDPKEYRNRARALCFNLGAADGMLRGRVVGGELQPAELVRLEAEELAPEALKAERSEERRKYFQSEVLVTERVPKRRRELLPRGRAAERLQDGEDEAEAASQGQEVPAAVQAEGDAAEEAAADAPAALLDAPAASAAPALAAVAAAAAEEASASAPSALPDAPGAGAAAEAAAAEEEGQPGPATPIAPAPAASPRLRRGRPLAEDEGQATPEAEAEAEDAALLLLEDTSNDDAIAKLLQMMPPTPSSSSSGSSSSSDSESELGFPAASLPAGGSSSSSSAAPAAPGALAGLDRVLAMGFDRGAAEAALVEASGNVEAAVALLCGGGEA